MCLKFGMRGFGVEVARGVSDGVWVEGIGAVWVTVGNGGIEVGVGAGVLIQDSIKTRIGRIEKRIFDLMSLGLKF